MGTSKQLILGASASLVILSGAQAADLPVKGKPVEYVRICSLYGAGFFFIPGTDTCIKIGGYLRADTTFNGGVHGAPAWNGDLGQQNRFRVHVRKSLGQERPQTWALLQEPLDPASLKLDGGLPTSGPLGGLEIPLQQVTDEHGDAALKSGLLPFTQIFHLFH